MKNSFISFLILLVLPFSTIGQFKNNVWCFGDSAGIIFHVNGTKSLFKSGTVNFISSVSISNKNDSLLFYAVTAFKPYFPSVVEEQGAIFNHMHSLMQNGDSLVGNSSLREFSIIPHPSDTNIFFLFQFPKRLTKDGCYYSIIDLSQNNGLGNVTQKNISLFQEGLHDGVAVKSGDGLNWWLISKKMTLVQPNDTFVLFNITSQGIIGPIFQKVGTMFPGSPMSLTFNSTGTKFILMTWKGLIEEFNFNRCTGEITFSRTIRKWSWANIPYFQFGAYSPNDRFFYFTSINEDVFPTPSIIYQIDLSKPIPWKTRDTIWYFDSTLYSWACIKSAPDGKIYVAVNANLASNSWPFPYNDTTYNMYNMNLGVINKPNKKGAACDFQPFSFYLGGARTYSGLPNNPDYALGPLVGSPCDTIQYTGLTPGPSPVGEGSLSATYISSWQKLFVNAQNIKGKNCVLKIFDINGREVFTSNKKTQPPYFTQDVDVVKLSAGLYLVNLITEKETLSAKFVKEK